MFGAGLKENENSLSDEPEADEVDVEECDPEVLHEERGLLEDKDEEKLEDDDGLEKKQALHGRDLVRVF